MTHHTLLRTVGAAALLSLSAGMAAQAQTVLTTSNGIVRSSLCVGTDCQTGISFSDSTIIVKENNTRIKFADTSTVNSFPRNDWELEANSQTNGGPNRFSIFDCGEGSNDGGCSAPNNVFSVEAGAGSNALYVDDGGRVGLGTSTPSVELHVIDGDTPTLRLQQDGSSGFAAQTWDVAGNETNFFVRDVTNGSALPFRSRPGAPTSSIDIAASGNVGIGTSAAAEHLHVAGSDTQIILLESTNDGAAQYRMKSDSGNRRLVAIDGSNNVETQIVFDNSQVQIAGPTNVGANLWAVINASGITTQGPDCNTPCDKVFDPEVFELESIEENAAYMWENQHLRAVGPTGPDIPFNVTEKTAGMLHELEKAHIYIEQLHTRLAVLEQRLSME